MVVTYDGSAFFGFQWQSTRPTVQGALEITLRKILGEKVRVAGSGRTDTGVHALGQVVSFLSECPIPVDKLIQAMNQSLPESIQIRSIEEVPPGFHARFSAKGKHYRYVIRSGVPASPFLHRYFCQIENCLDLERMKSGAKLFIGKHDFSAFSKSPAGLKDPFREIFHAELKQEGQIIVSSQKIAGNAEGAKRPTAGDEGCEFFAMDGIMSRSPGWARATTSHPEGGCVPPFIEKLQIIQFDVIGKGFLHNMVRNMAKALILIGLSQMDSDEIEELYRNQDRRRLGAPAPAGGLYLMKVMY